VLLALVPVNRVDDLFDLLNGQCVVIDRYFNPEDAVVIDASGQLVAKRRIPESVAGFAELTAVLADAGEDPDDPIPVAIETPRGLLVAVLRATGRQIYPINPMSVARYRERTSMSGKKSDHADAVTLANIVRTDADRHRRLPVDTELAQSITVLARAHQDATWRRNRAGNELRSLLREYFPGFLPSPIAPAESAHPKPVRCWPSLPPRPRRRDCPSRRSWPRCAVPDVNAA
jgi:hypothetical protein